MSYCVNPACTQPKNPKNAATCQSCGHDLKLHGRYQILGILGKGGFGATFAATDLFLPGRPICVVKQLRPTTDDPDVFKMAKELFEREAETLGRVGDHPQVPRLLDYFESNQQFYLVQEYVKGHNLHQEVRKNGPFSEAGVQQFLSEIMPILEYIHSKKVIHRDIKPANLIRRQTDCKLVLIDFGAVKNEVNTVVTSNTASQTALTNFAVGTAGFAPPEQMAMRPIYASDIFSIGVTCVFLLTGKTPKDIGTDPHTGELDWMKYVSVGKPFARVLQTMMELSIKQRYKTAREVLDALDLAPYDEGMRQNMISTGFLAPPPSSEPKTNTLRSNQSKRPERTAPPTITTKFSPPPSIVTRLKEKDNSSNPGTPLPKAPKEQPGYNWAPSRKIIGAKRGGEASQLQKIAKYTAKALMVAYERGNRDFAQQDLMDLQLPKVILAEINCYQSKLTRINLQGSDLSRGDFGRASLESANLKKANLYSAYLGYADLENADLRGADLTEANLRYANLRGANFCGANLTSANVTEDQIALAKVNWMTVMPSGKRGFW